MNLNRILAAADFSASSDNAVARAAQVAQACGAELHLIHAVPKLSWKLFGRALVEHPLITEKQMFDAAQGRMQELAHTCASRYGLQPRIAVEIGPPHNAVALHARQCKADLVVLGPHGASLTRSLFVGSTARRVMHAFEGPVLIARVPADRGYQHVLAAIDFTERSLEVLAAAAGLTLAAQLSAVHIYEMVPEVQIQYARIDSQVVARYREAAEEEAGRQMQQILERAPAGQRFTPVLRHGYPGPALLDEAQSLNADALAIGRVNRLEAGDLFLGSVAEHVLHHIDRDLLLV